MVAKLFELMDAKLELQRLHHERDHHGIRLHPHRLKEAVNEIEELQSEIREDERVNGYQG